MGRVKIVVIAAAFAALLAAQERMTVPFSDPNGPKRLTASLLRGSITVKTHASKDVTIEASGGRVRKRREPPPGMRRIDGGGLGLTAEESNNTVRISASPGSGADLVIYVPVDTSVKLNTVNNGNITVEGVSGEIDVNNLNGDVTVKDVSGVVVAHTLNGKLIVSLNRVLPDKTMSFSTLNGDVDVTLPADTKANVKMKSEHGDIFTDFDITLKPSSPQPVQETRREGRRYRIRFDRAMYGAINGGGPEFQFTTLNGTIYIRKK
ncbi:MAG: DUF4097 family beta strand repeat protein [Bryobacterales bacterium]|nr:DUF4097 family beta strand repeat protein [Bryobacterales bacterium]